MKRPLINWKHKYSKDAGEIRVNIKKHMATPERLFVSVSVPIWINQRCHNTIDVWIATKKRILVGAGSVISSSGCEAFKESKKARRKGRIAACAHVLCICVVGWSSFMAAHAALTDVEAKSQSHTISAGIRRCDEANAWFLGHVPGWPSPTDSEVKRKLVSCCSSGGVCPFAYPFMWWAVSGIFPPFVSFRPFVSARTARPRVATRLTRSARLTSLTVKESEEV